MTVPNEIEEYSVQRLVESGEVLRTLSPPTFASLHLVIDYEVSTQAEMAEIIGCVRPSISKYLQSLENLPIALVQKRGHDYSVTTAGERVFGLMDDMLYRLGTDLRSIDWSDEKEQKEVADCLTPLYDSRSTLPFLLLDSIRLLSGLEDAIGNPRPIEVIDIIDAVSFWKREMGGSVSLKQVRRHLQRFDDKRVLEFDDPQVRLLDKGQEHACMIYKINEVIGECRNETPETSMDNSSLGSDSTVAPSAETPKESLPEQNDIPTWLADQNNETRTPTIIAAYCVRDDEEDQPRPVFPLTSLTAKELAKRVSQLLENCGERTRLEPYWTVQTESGLHPIYPAGLQEVADLNRQTK